MGAALGGALGAALDAALATGAALAAGAALATGAALGAALGAVLGFVGTLGTERGVIRRLRGQVVDHFFSPCQVVDHFFALRQGQLGRLRLVFAAWGPASRPWRRLRLLHRFF